MKSEGLLRRAIRIQNAGSPTAAATPAHAQIQPQKKKRSASFSVRRLRLTSRSRTSMRKLQLPTC